MSDSNEIEFLQIQIEKLDLLLSGKIPKQSNYYGGGGAGGGGAGDGDSATADVDGAVVGDGAVDGGGGSAVDVDGGVADGGVCFETLAYEYNDKFNIIMSQLDEIHVFLRSICAGDFDIAIPGRKNYLSAPLKELHNQLSSLTWSMGQLSKGYEVGNLYYQGSLFDTFSNLTEKMTSISTQLEAMQSTNQSWDWSVNSWRNHQILSALNNLQIMVLEVAQDGKIVYANRPAKMYFGGIEYISRTKQNISSHSSILQDYLAQISFEGENGRFPKFREIFDEPNNCWYKITSDKVHFSDSHTGYLHMIDNINEWKKHENTLKRTATTDPLTGVYNRGFGLQALEEAIYDAKNGTPSCVAFIDMDGLKIINDVFGHTSGDYAIRTVADTLVSSVRDKKDVVFRFGGDEFIIIFINCVLASAQRAMVRMSAKLKEINSINQTGFSVDFSYGIIEVDSSFKNDLQFVIEKADQIMYKNKAAKKRVEIDRH